MDYSKYDDIRPLIPSEVPSAIKELLTNPVLEGAYNSLKMPIRWGDLASRLEACHSVADFKRYFSADLMRHIMRTTCREVAPLKGVEHITPSGAYTYISNHRDIILDSAFLNVLLDDVGAKYPQIAIGDNLMVQPWVETLVKLNGSFLVRRSLQGREFLLATRKLSEYMHEAIASGEALWIAQREGRAKDSSDRTQPALLKMLAIGAGGRDLLAGLAPLHIVPVCCSYEYDPCDYLKAREMQLKRDQSDYRKTKAEDTLNMATGVMGYKGRVSFALGRPLAELLEQVDWPCVKEAERVEQVAQLLDDEIHRHYQLYEGNYIAWDRLTGTKAHADRYDEQAEQTFDRYIDERLALIKLPEGIEPDRDFLSARLWEMYANPAINYHRAHGLSR